MHFPYRILAPLALGGAGPRAAIEPGQLSPQVHYPARFRLLERRRALDPPREVIGKAALVFVDRSPIDLQYRGAGRVEEPSVVGHEDEGAPVLEETPLEPLYGLDVEVVGRLVQEEELRLGSQGASYGGLLDHSARHLRHRRFGIVEPELGAERIVGEHEALAAQGLDPGVEAIERQALRAAPILVIGGELPSVPQEPRQGGSPVEEEIR